MNRLSFDHLNFSRRILFLSITPIIMAWSCATSPHIAQVGTQASHQGGSQSSLSGRVISADSATWAPSPWAYDAGPEDTEMGRELLDILAAIPDFRTVSGQVMDAQKFRYYFGPVTWRMLLKPNSIKILFIGQDATHIAEAANRPATAGYGGRAQDLAAYFGVDWSAAFINTFAGTIYGQYGFPDAPIITKGADGSAKVTNGSVIDNPLWLVAQDPHSPIVQWRNKLIDWIIRNNHDSLQMVVTFGGAARDTIATYLESKGAEVGTRTSREKLASMVVPKLKAQSTGSNGETGVPIDKDGNDLYAEALGRRVKYKDPKDLKAAQEAFAAAIAKDPKKWLERIVVSPGIDGSGILHPGQVRGYDVDSKLKINGTETISLKGLVVGGKPLLQDIPVVALPHPTRLSMMSKTEAAQAVAQALERIKPLRDSGWAIRPDHRDGLTNKFNDGILYEYGRTGMGPEYYDWGTPNSRMVAVSSASRLTANTIVFGTRDRVTFDKKKLEQMVQSLPSEFPTSDQLFNTRPRTPETRYIYDRGPGDKYAEMMFRNIPETLRENHAVNGDFSHYRGTFKNPKVFILADPDGYDDLITSRALTGARGQYLNGLMRDLGFGDKYLVLNTAPFSLVRTDVRDFKKILQETRTYREELISEIFKDGTPDFIIADGPFAVKEILRIFKGTPPCPIITMRRNRTDKGFEIGKTAEEIKKQFPHLNDRPISAKMADIPRSHLPYVSRLWEGAGGDRVITSNDPKYIGKAFAEVIPKWAYDQENIFRPQEETLLTDMLKAIRDGKPIDRLEANLLELRAGREIVLESAPVSRHGRPSRRKSVLKCEDLF